MNFGYRASSVSFFLLCSSLPVYAQIGPPVVIDCSPCTTVVASISTSAASVTAAINTSAASVTAAVNTNTTAQTTLAAQAIVFAITQSTLQITGAIDKNSTILEQLFDAKTSGEYIKENQLLLSRLRREHAVAPGGCLAPTVGTAIQSAIDFQNSADAIITKNNMAWNNFARDVQLGPSEVPRYLVRNVEAAKQSLGDEEDISLGGVIGKKNITTAQAELLQTYARVITNPRPAAAVLKEGEVEDDNSSLKQLHQDAQVDLAQATFSIAISRRIPSTDLSEWYTAVTGKQSEGPMSYWDLLETNAERRWFNPRWRAQLITASPTAVQRQQTAILSELLYINTMLLKEAERSNTLKAAILRKDAIDE